MFSESTTIGVEVVIKDFAVMSTGKKIEILSTCKTL
jgi:predicted thioesterase